MRVRPGADYQLSASVRGTSAAGDWLFGATDILSDAPSRHIRVPLSANPRPRWCLGTLLV
ncbi:hypothetical protein XspCFBP7912_18350 [Xanthomonas sp. CFBP 7912]|nr:hypothetical protein XspCFBP7912_18350 [Xanthomonas sp. CFBP 7912]RJS01738.1 hypothetical protein XnspCFBP7698_20610 [Xanthomonas sp. CFBP 7698]